MRTEYYPTYTDTAESKAWYRSENVCNCAAFGKNKRRHGIVKAISEWLRIPKKLGNTVEDFCER